MTALELDDIQGLVVRGYGHIGAARYVLLGIRDPVAARRWIADTVPVVTSAAAGAGASLMPSPIITVPPGVLIRSALTASTFSIGIRSASTPSTPMAAPTVSATAG